MLAIKKRLRGFRPLACGDDYVVLSKGNRLYISGNDLCDVSFLCEIPSSLSKVYLSKLRIFSRILRLGINYFFIFDQSTGFAVRKNEIWRVNLSTGEVKLDFVIPFSRGILNMSLTRNSLDGCSNTIVFGEYFENPDKGPVNIWSCNIDRPQSWEVAHTFQSGEINHIHNIFQDESTGKLIIFCGDFGNASSLWIADYLFDCVEPIFRGEQKFRGTWGCRLNKGVYYAMDSQLEQNYLCRLNQFEEDSTLELISEIEGSSIYCGVNDKGVYFSTAVEPGEPTGNLLVDMFSRTRGNGILSEESFIYFLNDTGVARKVYCAKKDFIPARLGQFGTFTFPSGPMPAGHVIAYGIALSSVDNCCLLLS